MTDPRVEHLAVSLRLDPRQRHFRGEMVLHLGIDAPLEVLTLRANALRLGDCHARVSGRRIRLSPRAAEPGRLCLAAAEPLEGEAQVHLTWTGSISERPEGLWRVEFAHRSALVAWLADGGAHRLMPGLDVPDQRASHALTIYLPVGLTAVASSRLLERRSVGTEVCWRFATTPPIPSSTLGFAVGAFEIDDGPTTPCPIRVLAPRGALGEGRVAHLVAERLEALEALFDHRQAYGKLDLLVMPGLPRATATLPGLVLCRPSALESPALARALAQLWTGLLVSPTADARWLANALATVAARLVSQSMLHADELSGAREAALALDALPEPAAHPYRDVALLEMLVRWMGEAGFVQAVRRFIRRHAHRSATRQDWIDALGDPVAATIADDLLGRPGLLLVRGHLASDQRLQLTQTRYGEPDGSLTDRTIPVHVRIGAGGRTAEVRCLVRGPITTVALPFAPAWLHLNAGQTGYYRWIGPADRLEALCGRARGELSLTDRVGLPGDLQAHFEQGVLPADAFLDRLLALLSDESTAVRTAALNRIQTIGRRLLPDSHRAAFNDLVRERLEPLAEPLLTAPPTDLTYARVLLTLLIDAECPRCRPVILEHALTALVDPGWRPRWARVVLPLASTWAGAPYFDQLIEALDVDQPAGRRSALIAAVGSVTDPLLVQRALERLPLNRLRGAEVLDLLRPLARRRAHRDLIRGFVEQHFEALMARYGAALLTRLPGLARDVRTASERSAWATTFASPRMRPRGMADAVRRMLGMIDRNLRQAAEASAALRARLGTGTSRPPAVA